jgi:hypothetical protein
MEVPAIQGAVIGQPMFAVCNPGVAVLYAQGAAWVPSATYRAGTVITFNGFLFRALNDGIAQDYLLGAPQRNIKNLLARTGRGSALFASAVWASSWRWLMGPGSNDMAIRCRPHHAPEHGRRQFGDGGFSK